MGLLISFILFIAICALVFWIFDAISTAHQELKRQPEVIRKVEEKTAKMAKSELLFSQFGNYILNLFEERDSISKNELLTKLKIDYPYYKKDILDLFYDLRSARLLKSIHGRDDYFQLGKSFENFKLTQVELIEFMKSKCINSKFRSGFIDDWEIYEIEINSTSKIFDQDIYFSFGACSGKNITQKIKIQPDKIDVKSFYLYGKSYKNSFNNKNLESIVTQNYCVLDQNINFEKIFNQWYLLSIPF